jgi:hypothetical protein
VSNLYKDPVVQKEVLRLVDAAGHEGRTIAEIRDLIPAKHHGTLSGVLSVLHRDLRLARLSEKRNGCKVYVHPDFLAGRDAEAQGRGGATKEEIDFALSVVGALEYWLQVDSAGARFATDKTKAERNQPLFFREIKGLWAQRDQ